MKKPEAPSMTRIGILMKGGLGNQLFQYFAGNQLAADNPNAAVELDFSSIADREHEGSDLRGFQLNRSFSLVDFRPKNSRRNKIYAGLEIMLVASRRYFRYGRKITITEPGWTQIDLAGHKRILLDGYFQSWRYMSTLGRPSVSLRGSSAWLASMEKKLDKESAIALHVRRGDYANSNEFGLLDSLYYLRAVEALRTKVERGRIWVFCDDILAAKDLLGEVLTAENPRWIEPSSELSPHESLILMSKCVAIITANSSFSWWGANLGASEKLVLAPLPWFKELEEPEQLIPENWIRIRASWEQ